jgi:hypothetical protein
LDILLENKEYETILNLIEIFVTIMMYQKRVGERFYFILFFFLVLCRYTTGDYNEKLILKDNILINKDILANILKVCDSISSISSLTSSNKLNNSDDRFIQNSGIIANNDESDNYVFSLTYMNKFSVLNNSVNKINREFDNILLNY